MASSFNQKWLSAWSSPRSGYCDESTKHFSFSPQFRFVFQHFVFGCVYLYGWRPPITIKAQLPFSPNAEFPCYCFCYGNRCLFIYLFYLGLCMHPIKVRPLDSSGSTYCIQFSPSRQHSCWYATTSVRKIPHHNLQWHQKLELRGFWGGRWVSVLPGALRVTAKKTGQQSLVMANFSEICGIELEASDSEYLASVASLWPRT